MSRRMTVAQRKQRIRERNWKLLDLLHLAWVNFLLYSAFTGLEYALIEFGFLLLVGDAQNSPFLTDVISVVRVGLALVNLIAMIIHSGFSFYGAIQMERTFQEEDVK